MSPVTRIPLSLSWTAMEPGEWPGAKDYRHHMNNFILRILYPECEGRAGPCPPAWTRGPLLDTWLGLRAGHSSHAASSPAAWASPPGPRSSWPSWTCPPVWSPRPRLCGPRPGGTGGRRRCGQSDSGSAQPMRKEYYEYWPMRREWVSTTWRGFSEVPGLRPAQLR